MSVSVCVSAVVFYNTRCLKPLHHHFWYVELLCDPQNATKRKAWSFDCWIFSFLWLYSASVGSYLCVLNRVQNRPGKNDEVPFIILPTRGQKESTCGTSPHWFLDLLNRSGVWDISNILIFLIKQNKTRIPQDQVSSPDPVIGNH